MVENKKRSIFRVLLVPLLAVIAVQVIFMMGSLFFGGVFRQLTHNMEEILQGQVENRGNYLLNEMIGNWSELDDLSENINQRVQEGLDDGTFTMDELCHDSQAYTPLLNETAQLLIDVMHTKQVSGAFVILVGSSEPQDDTLALPGLWFRDRDPQARPSQRLEDILVQRAPHGVVQTGRLTTDTSWTPLISEKDSIEQDYFKPYYAAMSGAAGAKADAADYGYWTRKPYTLSGDKQTAISYSLPLMLEDGTVYGVLGVELLTDYMESLLPMRELNGDGYGTYLMAVAGEGESTLAPVVISGDTLTPEFLEQNPFVLSEDDTKVAEGSSHYYAVVKPLVIYSRNAPFEGDKWYLLGSVPEVHLYTYIDQLAQLCMISAVMCMMVGFCGILLVSYRISRPIQRLAEQVELARNKDKIPTLPAVRIFEIDQLVDAITRLSQEVLTTSVLEKEKVETERDHDALTGLLNRQGFRRNAEKLFANPEQLKISALLMLDMDNLKITNDKFGHSVGDQYIQRMGRCLRENTPQTALCARISGDEFLVLYYGYDDKDEIWQQVRQLFQVLHSITFILPDGVDSGISGTGGVAWYPKDSSELSELMKYSDFAMYCMKKQERGGVCEFDMNAYQETLMRNKLRQEFYQLLEQRRMNYHFQPIFDGRTGEPFAYEALMRPDMPHLRSPLAVLEHAKETDRMRDVETLTLFGAAESYERLLKQQSVSPEALLFINSISDTSMTEENNERFSQRFLPLLKNTVLELTETESLDMSLVEKKRSLTGFSGMLALDDYGSGYNTELNLLELNPAFIKVDVAIVRNIHQDENKQHLVRNIVEYAHKRGMRIIAEGLEYPEEVEKSLELGVDLLQGYFLAKPGAVPPSISAEALALIRDYCKRNN